MNHPVHSLSASLRRPMLWLIAPLMLGLQACANPAAPAAEPTTATLWGTQWTLVSMGAQAVMPTPQATLQFAAPDRVSGNGSCNRFSGAVTVNQDRIQFGNLASTKIACMGGAMAQESAYLGALGKAQRFERRGDTLLIHVDGMAQPMRFTIAK
ncbi:MAG: META domain-containing protein [Hydrogenophaga sp.]